MSLARRLRWTALIARHLPGEARFPFRSPDAIRRAQARRVGEAVRHAYETVPYYREVMRRLGLRPGDFRDASDLARLPLLERDPVQRDPEYFVSEAHPLSAYRELHSTGSTGTPLTLYLDARATFLSAIHGERQRAIVAQAVGRRFGYREASIVPPRSTVRETQEFHRSAAWLPPRLRTARHVLSMFDEPERNRVEINRLRPDVLVSYGLYIEMLFVHLERTGRRMHMPKAVVYGAEQISPPVVRLVRERFGVPIFGSYQAVEAQRIAFECDASGLHVNVDLSPIRIVSADGGPVAAGERGEVVVSNLLSRATVLLNYRLGDLAAALPGPCPCGRSLPLMSYVEGRSDDWVERSDGVAVHPRTVASLFRHEPDVWGFQVRQLAPTRVEVALVAPHTGDRGATARRIAGNVQAELGEGVAVDVRFVEGIDPGPAGKRKSVVRM